MEDLVRDISDEDHINEQDTINKILGKLMEHAQLQEGQTGSSSIDPELGVDLDLLDALMEAALSELGNQDFQLQREAKKAEEACKAADEKHRQVLEDMSSHMGEVMSLVDRMDERYKGAGVDAMNFGKRLAHREHERKQVQHGYDLLCYYEAFYAVANHGVKRSKRGSQGPSGQGGKAAAAAAEAGEGEGEGEGGLEERGPQRNEGRAPTLPDIFTDPKQISLPSSPSRRVRKTEKVEGSGSTPVACRASTKVLPPGVARRFLKAKPTIPSPTRDEKSDPVFSSSSPFDRLQELVASMNTMCSILRLRLLPTVTRSADM